MLKVTPRDSAERRIRIQARNCRTESSRESHTNVPSSLFLTQQPSLGHRGGGNHTSWAFPARGLGSLVFPGSTEVDLFAALRALASFLFPRAPEPPILSKFVPQPGWGPSASGSRTGQSVFPTPASEVNHNNHHQRLLIARRFTPNAPKATDQQTPRNYCPRHTDEAALGTWVMCLDSKS